MLICPNLIPSPSINDTAFHSAIARMCDTYNDAKGSNIKRVMGSLCRSIYTSDPKHTLSLTDQDYEFFKKYHPEVYFFILSVTAYRSRATYSLNDYREEFKEALKSSIREYEKSLDSVRILSGVALNNQLPDYMFFEATVTNKMEHQFRFKMVALWRELLCEICNEAAGFGALFLHSLYRTLYTTSASIVRFGEYHEFHDYDCPEKEAVLVNCDINDHFTSIRPENILTSLFIVLSKANNVPALGDLFGDVTTAWLYHLMGRKDGIEVLTQPRTLSLFFNPSPYLHVKALLQELTDAATEQLGRDHEQVKSIRRHFNYLKLKNQSF